ncbi:MAG: acyl-CoA thioesterase [Pirellulaceae bacterium]|nr:acyl-CoA thioesterase [Pirellulaceae bacterium]
MNLLPEHQITIRVRYQETDAQGWVHHGNYLTYFEMGRVEQLRASNISYRQMEEKGLFLVVAEANCQYRLPARYDDLLVLHTQTLKAKGARIWHEYKLWRGDELLVTGKTTLACVSDKGKVKRLPEWLLPT